MDGPLPGTPSPETVDTAYKSLVEFGVVGAVLAIVLVFAISLVWWVLNSSKKRIDKVEGDAKSRVDDVEKQSNVRAKSYREIIEMKDQQLERLEKRLNEVQEKRVTGMEVAVVAVTKMNERTGRIMGMLKAILDQLEVKETDYQPDEDNGG